MGIGGVSIFLMAVGTILAFAVHATVSGISIQMVGVILIIAGLVGLLTTLFIFGPRQRAAVVDDRIVRDRDIYCGSTGSHRRTSAASSAWVRVESNASGVERQGGDALGAHDGGAAGAAGAVNAPAPTVGSWVRRSTSSTLRATVITSSGRGTAARPTNRLRRFKHGTGLPDPYMPTTGAYAAHLPITPLVGLRRSPART